MHCLGPSFGLKPGPNAPLGQGSLIPSARIQVIATFPAVLCWEGTLVAAETPLPLLGEAHLVFQHREHVRSSGRPTQSTPKIRT
jgi:hypothetical protein